MGRDSPSPILKTYSILNKKNIYYNLLVKIPLRKQKKENPAKTMDKIIKVLRAALRALTALLPPRGGRRE